MPPCPGLLPRRIGSAISAIWLRRATAQPCTGGLASDGWRFGTTNCASRRLLADAPQRVVLTRRRRRKGAAKEDKDFVVNGNTMVARMSALILLLEARGCVRVAPREQP